MTLWDDGAQPERTDLAWARTALALVALGLIAVRLAPTGMTLAFGAGASLVATALLLRQTRTARRRRHRRLTARACVADPISVLLATVVTVLLAVTAGAWILLHP